MKVPPISYENQTPTWNGLLSAITSPFPNRCQDFVKQTVDARLQRQRLYDIAYSLISSCSCAVENRGKSVSQKELIAKHRLSTIEMIRKFAENSESLGELFDNPLSSKTRSTVKLLLENKDAFRTLKRATPRRTVCCVTSQERPKASCSSRGSGGFFLLLRQSHQPSQYEYLAEPPAEEGRGARNGSATLRCRTTSVLRTTRSSIFAGKVVTAPYLPSNLEAL